MDFQEMQSIMEIFAEKLLFNLVYSDGSSENGRSIIKSTLDVFDIMVSTTTSCRMFIKLDIIK